MVGQRRNRVQFRLFSHRARPLRNLLLIPVRSRRRSQHSDLRLSQLCSQVLSLLAAQVASRRRDRRVLQVLSRAPSLLASHLQTRRRNRV